VVAVREQPQQRERERERQKKNILQEDAESTTPGKEGKVIHR
jgi:hypothetical protein